MASTIQYSNKLDDGVIERKRKSEDQPIKISRYLIMQMPTRKNISRREKYKKKEKEREKNILQYNANFSNLIRPSMPKKTIRNESHLEERKKERKEEKKNNQG